MKKLSQNKKRLILALCNGKAWKDRQEMTASCKNFNGLSEPLQSFTNEGIVKECWRPYLDKKKNHRRKREWKLNSNFSVYKLLNKKACESGDREFLIEFMNSDYCRRRLDKGTPHKRKMRVERWRYATKAKLEKMIPIIFRKV